MSVRPTGSPGSARPIDHPATGAAIGERPAILSGSPAVTLPQDEALRWPIITAEDEAAVLRVLRSGELAVSAEVAALEDDYRRRLDVPHVIAHNNGTGAIHAAMHAFDLEPGDEVIVPSATWWASVMPDASSGRGACVRGDGVPACMRSRPRGRRRRRSPPARSAIMVVHLFGMPSTHGRTSRRLPAAHDLRMHRGCLARPRRDLPRPPRRHARRRWPSSRCRRTSSSPPRRAACS